MGQTEPRQRKVEARLNFPRPNSKKTLSSWVSLASYFQRFLPNFAHIVSVLTDLLRKNVHYHWSEKAEMAFVEIKDKMASTPICTTPHFDLQFLIAFDCSNVALGDCLFHIIDDIEHPICYISQKLNNHQRNYSTIEKECYALLVAVRRFSVYFGNSHVLVYTDHNPLMYLATMSLTNQKLMRWRLQFQECDLEIVYRQGKQNILPYILSRSDK